ncbi:hypothetical protein Cme02nite_56590 [Catellatospora methionotrophica]|uniref:Uncharacterized protein n=1 Tax=Catellatospora methionotrophica TaxID=121620 RepID=A0A8J3PHG8_9ACTN|nr:hypothetical protein [Catellatospora methionotrophica]GIG17327.1 hypothetical protein Cme02nite_56590 [Catellatospora methionotrophica]
MTEPARARHGVPGLALGTAMLVAERLRRLTSPVDPAEQARIEDMLTGGVEPSPASARSPVAVAVGLTQQSYDLAVRTRNRIGEATRGQARRLADATRAALPASPIDTARDVVSSAGQRGHDTLVSSRAAASVALRDTVDESLTWVEKTIVPRMMDNLMPYLINSVVPRLVEGAIPEIRRKVIPVVIDDMTRDPRLQELITEQSRGVLANATDELRETSASADDRIESSFRRVFHRHHTNGDR